MSIDDKFTHYLPTVGIEGPIRERVKSIYQIVKVFCPSSIEDLFISDATTPGGRQYFSLFFFSPSYVLEVKLFLQQDSFDITPIKKRVYYYELQSSKYDFERATDRSVLTATALCDAGVRLKMQASKANCNFLKTIILTYFKSNLVER